MLSRPYDWRILSMADDVQDAEQTPLYHSLSTQNWVTNPQQNLITPTAIPIFFKTKTLRQSA